MNYESGIMDTRRITGVFLLLVLLFFPLVSAHADTTYPGLVPCTNKLIPAAGAPAGSQTIENQCSVCSLFVLVHNVLNFIYYYVAAPVGAIMLMYGGFLMLSAGIRGADPAKGNKVLTNALVGILITFFAWLGVDTIIKLVANQSLTSISPAVLFPEKPGDDFGMDVSAYGPWNEIKCKEPAPPVFTPPVKAPVTSTPTTATSLPSQPPTVSGQLLDDTTARTKLTQAKIQVVSTGGCSDQGRSSCTSLEGIPQVAVDELTSLQQRLKAQCSECSLTVTGGTETGHQTHGTGKSVVDISSKDFRVNQFFQGMIGVQSPEINKWYKGGDNNFYFYERDHWHVCLTPACAPHTVANDQIRGL